MFIPGEYVEVVRPDHNVSFVKTGMRGVVLGNHGSYRQDQIVAVEFDQQYHKALGMSANNVWVLESMLCLVQDSPFHTSLRAYLRAELYED